MHDITLIKGDCLQIMPKLPTASFDMICADLPYGTTACPWDVVIPFESLWAEYKRLIKPRGAIVLFGLQPFTSLLVCSNLTWFKYEIIWEKDAGSNFAACKFVPMKVHENILVFAPSTPKYNPQKRETGRLSNRGGYNTKGEVYGRKEPLQASFTNSTLRYPRSVVQFDKPKHNTVDKKTNHPTQKPVALLENLILTYTDPGDTVLDNTMGSGTTIVACIKTGRCGMGIELRQDYFEIAQDRITKARLQLPLLSNTAVFPTMMSVGLFDLATTNTREEDETRAN